MTKREIQQMEMLVRVRDFGVTHASLFPESTLRTPTPPSSDRSGFSQCSTASSY